MTDLDLYFDSSRDLAMATNYSRKIGLYTDQSNLSCCHSDMDYNIAILISKFYIKLISLHCVQFRLNHIVFVYVFKCFFLLCVYI